MDKELNQLKRELAKTKIERDGYKTALNNHIIQSSELIRKLVDYCEIKGIDFKDILEFYQKEEA